MDDESTYINCAQNHASRNDNHVSKNDNEKEMIIGCFRGKHQRNRYIIKMEKLKENA